MLLAVDKPQGITSYDVIRQLKKYFPKKTKIGHAGTLDPMATGLLLIGVGKGTKRLHELTGNSKTYETTIDFSIKTDTRDMDYRKEIEHLGPEALTQPTQETLSQQLDSIIPSAQLPLTPFSAKKVEGKKLYEYAREGKPLYMDAPMSLLSYTILSYNFPHISIALHVGKGTYIRSIGHWLGVQNNLGGTLTALRRTSIGEYNLNNYDMKEKDGLQYSIIDSDSDDEKLECGL